MLVCIVDWFEVDQCVGIFEYFSSAWLNTKSAQGDSHQLLSSLRASGGCSGEYVSGDACADLTDNLSENQMKIK